MGVHGLWDLLAPVGRRVSVETLSGKKLAIDASIWMIQFMKAMRDEKGEMVRNAHLIGFFRRICKLLYLKTKPVFVFDGGTPALKRRTVIARRRQRENAQAKIRKTAEKLLINHLKTMRLKELALDLENQRQIQKRDPEGKKVLSDMENCSERTDGVSASDDKENLDEMLAASIAAEANESSSKSASKSATANLLEEDGDEDEEIMLPTMGGNVDPAVFAALPPSMQHQLLVRNNDAKGKNVLSDDLGQADTVGISPESHDGVSKSRDHKMLDEMLAASIAAEEDGSLSNNASASAASLPLEEEDGDEDEEMILPAMTGNVDPAVLAALPPSMQLDLLVQMREQLMAENRQKYQKVKKAPEKFSELQIQAYLKTVAFRREIDEVQKAAAGRGVAGVQTSRIASEANREFIFSSSFTGDKQVLTSSRVEGKKDEQQQIPSEHPVSDSVNNGASIDKSNFSSTDQSNSVTKLGPGESRKSFADDVETYLDERGRVRLSKVRAMGIRMTRDLQRNLAMMKEIEQDRPNGNNITDSDWEEGTTERKGSSLSDDANAGINPPLNLEEGGISDESEVEWEEGPSCAPKSSLSFPAESEKTVSNIEEEANLQEAIRRSLLDVCIEKPNYALSEHNKCENLGENACDGTWLYDRENNMDDPNFLGESVSQQHESICEYVDGLGKLDTVGGINNSEVIGSLGRELKLYEPRNSDEKEMLINKPFEKDNSYFEQSRQGANDGANDGRSLCSDAPCEDSGTTMELTEVQLVKGRCLSASAKGDEHLTRDKMCSDDRSHSVDAVFEDSSIAILDEDKKNNCEAETSVLPGDKKNEIEVEMKHDFTAEPSCRTVGTSDTSIPLVKTSGNASIYDTDIEQKSAEERTPDTYLKDSKQNTGIFATKAIENVHAEATEKILEEEMQILDHEYMYLGDEQKKLERNAESVSSEMFAECQELLQMFGLPYIIAPMEAEAQCAYMELANLVDGVVTDDSDVFLFGARSVYKNIFDDRKYVETYFMQDIEKDLGLTREKLIRMALLLGSDYTEGISGIGIVNAIEVVNAFPEEDGLSKFREWIESPDPTILGKFDVQTGASSRKRRSSDGDKDVNYAKHSVEGVSEFDESISQFDEDKQSAEYSQNMKKIFMDKHRNVSKNWHIPSSFPSEAVISAYFCPQVDKSTESFSWGKPDLFVLRKFCWEKFGWGGDKSNELLVPVLKEYEKRETQLRLEAFYTFNERFAKIRSKRIKKAVKGITGNQSLLLMDDAGQEVSKSRNKRKNNGLENGSNRSQKAPKKGEESVSGAQNNMEKSSQSQSRKRKVLEKFVLAEMENPERLTPAGGGRNANNVFRGNRRGKGQRVGRGRGRGRLCAEQSETSSSDDIGSDDTQEYYSEKFEGQQEVRRSTRSRKPVDYNVDDPEIADVGKILSNKESSNEEEAKQDSVHGVTGEASADYSRKKQHRADDPSIDKDYIERGGGFCIDDQEIGQPSVSPCDDPFLEAEITKDYMKMGGGFCHDESETREDQVAAKDPVVTGESPSTCFDSSDGVHCDVGLGDSTTSSNSKEATNGLENVGRTDTFDTEPNPVVQNATSTDSARNDAGRASRGSLTAMTFLRRKRRRS
ncbi:DNA repair protein UVH3 isoform X2 [Citrus sinensis]|uniref:DNA repair protein UVH3 isoform X3 n=1 Tax=Citrus clementina TaxID=85681 RepID=UPI000CED247A|nr:DNA repair protein UVH3 isoform X3 [Citrus x clementina]XP_052291367.1 DNA repair protein UVH3 isoform X2 [Citrus sinensis]